MASSRFVIPDYSAGDASPGNTAKARAEAAQAASLAVAAKPPASSSPPIANSNARQGRKMNASQGPRPKSKGNAKSVVPLT